jgi:putative membrane protein
MTTAPPELSAATEMALDRTRLAYERTLMAWVRTATSLISFGFSLHKFFQYLRESQSTPPVHHAFGPREFALTMIGIGLTVLLVATLEHRRDLQALRAKYGPVPYSLASLLAILISGLGIVGFVVVLLRL